jgi:perosamine synthetase
MVRVMEIAKANDLFVVEDCALAIGTSQKSTHAGLFGDAGVFSFYPVKHMTTAEGGMVITQDGELAQRLRLRKAFGVDRAMHERKVPGIYDVVTLGYNFRMNELQAAIGIEQVKKLDRFLAARTANFDALDAGLREAPEITLFDRAGDGFVSSHYCFNMMLDADKADQRTDVIQALNARGIGTSVHYPGPVPQTTYYRDRFGHKPEDHPVANWISNCSIALPVGPHLDESHMTTIVAAVKDVISEVLK